VKIQTGYGLGQKQLGEVGMQKCQVIFDQALRHNRLGGAFMDSREFQGV
jgi:hypothetical protein